MLANILILFEMIIRIRITIFDFFSVVAHNNQRKKICLKC